MKILNLTQHAATDAQLAAGVIEPADKDVIKSLLTFDDLPSRAEILERAKALANIAAAFEYAMLGGAPFFMSALEEALSDIGVIPMYAFSVRESVEQHNADGTVTKVNVFRHKGFVG